MLESYIPTLRSSKLGLGLRREFVAAAGLIKCCKGWIFWRGTDTFFIRLLPLPQQNIVFCRKVTPKQSMSEHVKIQISLSSRKRIWETATWLMLKVQVIIILSHTIAVVWAFIWASPYQTGQCFSKARLQDTELTLASSYPKSWVVDGKAWHAYESCTRIIYFAGGITL